MIGAILFQKSGGAALAFAAIALASCAAPSSYMGISLRPNAASFEIQQIAQRAMNGDKHAQLALGIRYEEGRGLPVNLRWAKRLYASAARDSGGESWVYVPPAKKGGQGRTMLVNLGPRQAGLSEAKVRLVWLAERNQ